MSRSNTGLRSRSESTRIPESGSRRRLESNISVGGSRTNASQDDPDTQVDRHWAFVKPKKSNDDSSFAITLYYPEHTKFSKVKCVKYQKAYFDAETKTLVIEVNPN